MKSARSGAELRHGAADVVIGGGLAGAAVALELARGGSASSYSSGRARPTSRSAATSERQHGGNTAPASASMCAASAPPRSRPSNCKWEGAPPSPHSFPSGRGLLAPAPGRGVAASGRACGRRGCPQRSGDRASSRKFRLCSCARTPRPGRRAACAGDGERTSRAGRGTGLGDRVRDAVRVSGPRGMPLRRVHLAACDGGYIGACLIEHDIASVCWLAQRAPHCSVRRRLAGAAGFLRAALGGDRQHSWGGRALRRQRLRSRRSRCATRAAPQSHPTCFRSATSSAISTGDGMCLALSSAVAAGRAVLEGRTAGHSRRPFAARLWPQFRWASAIDAGFKSDPAQARNRAAAQPTAARHAAGRDAAPARRPTSRRWGLGVAITLHGVIRLL